MSKGLKIMVNCYSGYMFNERPTSFIIGKNKLNVEEIIDRWYGPEYSYFKIRASDKNIYILKYNERKDKWELEFFKKNG